jgi:hypothetical protein
VPLVSRSAASLDGSRLRRRRRSGDDALLGLVWTTGATGDGKIAGMLERRAEAYARVEQEFQQERAAALGRIAGTLERLLARLETLRQRAEAVNGPAREAVIAEHAEVRAQALTYRWYLEVQRESVGLRRHDTLDAIYPVPPALR